MIPFISPEQDHRLRNRDVRNDEQSPIEWFLESSRALNEQEEDVEKQIESVDPVSPEGFERVRAWHNPLTDKSFADTQISKHDARPCNIGCGASD